MSTKRLKRYNRGRGPLKARARALIPFDTETVVRYDGEKFDARNWAARKRLVLTALLVGGLVLSGACGAGSHAPPAQRGTTTATSADVVVNPDQSDWGTGPVRPGESPSEPTVIGVGPDERGSLYLWALDGATSIEIAIDNYVCKPGGEPCTTLPASVCAPVVTTEVCSLASLDSAPQCVPTTLYIGQPATVTVSGAYAGVRMVAGTCLDAERTPEPLQPGQWWMFLSPDHPRACDRGPCPMEVGGGTPQKGENGQPATVSYTQPVGGPR